MADLNLQEIHDFMISIARKAGEMITSAHPTTEQAGSKKNCTCLFFLPTRAENCTIFLSVRCCIVFELQI